MNLVNLDNFYWEYGHRILGRLIGLFIIIPLLYFQFCKKLNLKFNTGYLSSFEFWFKDSGLVSGSKWFS